MQLDAALNARIANAGELSGTASWEPKGPRRKKTRNSRPAIT